MITGDRGWFGRLSVENARIETKVNVEMKSPRDFSDDWDAYASDALEGMWLGGWVQEQGDVADDDYYDFQRSF